MAMASSSPKREYGSEWREIAILYDRLTAGGIAVPAPRPGYGSFWEEVVELVHDNSQVIRLAQEIEQIPDHKFSFDPTVMDPLTQRSREIEAQVWHLLKRADIEVYTLSSSLLFSAMDRLGVFHVPFLGPLLYDRCIARNRSPLP